MIDHSDLYRFADDSIFSQSPLEVELRRAISSLYYALFHRLSSYGASVFSDGGIALEKQAARAYNHGSMRKVCEAYNRAARGRFDPPLENIAPSPPSQHVLTICDAFVRLQEARHQADYDLAISFSHDDAIGFSALADRAFRALLGATDVAETRVFLTALLLADRWTRRG